VGIAVSAATVAAVVAIMVFARLGIVHGRTMRLYVEANRGEGIIPGTEVWLDGIKVGAVRWVRFQPPSTDTTKRLLIAVDVVEDVRQRIRGDTRVSIEPGSSQLGAPVIQLRGGHLGALPLPEGDTLVTRDARRLGTTREQLALTAQSLPVVLSNFNTVLDHLSSHSVTIGADTRRLEVLRGQANRLMADTAFRHGSIALAISDGFGQRVQQVVARADSLMKVVAGPAGAGARMGPDGDLTRAVDQVDSELTALHTQVERRRATDPQDTATLATLRTQIDQLHERLRSLVADVAHRPLRYMNF
jgi:ABC-type transporter Mla subunit MlaD